MKNEKKKEDEILEEEFVDEVVEVVNADEDQNVEVDESDTDEEIKSEDEVVKLQKELEESNNKYLRLNADFQNFRKRTEREKAEIYKYANEKLIIELLPLVDNMERALEHIDEENKSSVVDGLKMIHKGFIDTLSKNDVEAIIAIGEEFDPQIHNAVMMEESDEFESNIVIGEFQKGYKIKEKVIRHSMVKVSQ